MNIRKALTADAAGIAAVHISSWQSAFAVIIDEDTMQRHSDRERITAMYQRSLENGETAFVCEAEGKLSGFCFAGKARGIAEEDLSELICIHVRPEEKHRGIGTALLQKAMTEAKAQGYGRMCLWVFRENVSARNFYEKHGFVYAGISDIRAGAEEWLYLRNL